MSVAESVMTRVIETGLLPAGQRVLVLLSGGRDSVCLLDLALRLAGPASVAALHVNYGLRDTSAGDEAFCADLCDTLGVELEIRRPRRPENSGNLQAWARDQRYAAAAQLALARSSRVATGHTASDQVETVLYRLAASPGRRALLGMRGQDGRLVRPLLCIARDETAASNAERGLGWREDPTNQSGVFARNRIRHGLLAELRAVHPAAEANVLATLELLRDEADVLDAAVESALAVAGQRGHDGGTGVADLNAMAPALRRLAIQKLADEAAGGRAAAIGSRTEEILRLGREGGNSALDLGEGLRAMVEYGRLRFAVGSVEDSPEPATLAIPGRASFGAGELSSQRGPHLEVGEADASGRSATLDAAALAAVLEVRSWAAGDRMRPLGLDGSKSLQDLFGDRRVRRESRARLPVVLSAGEIAWIPGVAIGEGFKVTSRTRERVRLAWQPSAPGTT
ncbi:MAG: tRNA lysidine(34) synthetase TilS [Solirubrobacterales bacterium]|nr:tRNA lysidine(34) synthetase TilS [Solirubrobacterales bacterium]